MPRMLLPITRGSMFFFDLVGHLRVAKERHAPQTRPVVAIRQAAKPKARIDDAVAAIKRQWQHAVRCHVTGIESVLPTGRQWAVGSGQWAVGESIRGANISPINPA